MGRWVGQKMAEKIGYPLWMAPKDKNNFKHPWFLSNLAPDMYASTYLTS